MRPSTLVQFLNIAATAYGAVIAPVKRSTPCSTVVVLSTQDQTRIETTTETQVTTVVTQPASVTVALQDPDAITSSLSSAFSVESEQLEIASQIAPINPLTSGRPPTTTSANVFTRTIAVPVVEATNNATIPGQSSTADVYFIGESNGMTSWLTNFTPEESMTIGTTTVTLSPVAATPSSLTSSFSYTARVTRTNTVIATVSQPRLAPSAAAAEVPGSRVYGWNSSTVSTADRTGTLVRSKTQALNASSSLGMVTFPRSSTIATHTVPLSALTSIALPTGADGLTANITFPTADYYRRKRSGDELRQRAVCEWVTATMRGVPASWQNNWDGSQTVDCATISTSSPPSPPAAAVVTVTVAVEPTSAASAMTTTESTLEPEAAASISSTATGTAPAGTTSCSVSGDFGLDFETLPEFYAPDNDTAPMPPIFNEYCHLFFSSGWAYVPPPTVPVMPQEGDHLAIYVPRASETNGSVPQSFNAGQVPGGAFGAGPRASASAYWFDAKTMYVFCDSGAADATIPCDVVATGYQWEEASRSERVAVTQHFPQPACPGYHDCRTNQIFFNDEFRRLSSLGLYGVVDGQRKRMFMDTVQLTWSSNTHDALLSRASHARGTSLNRVDD